MTSYRARHNYVPHIRHWRPGLIAITAKTRIDFLLRSSNMASAQAMISEWVID